jgi:hypothetical protein
LKSWRDDIVIFSLKCAVLTFFLTSLFIHFKVRL